LCAGELVQATTSKKEFEFGRFEHKVTLAVRRFLVEQHREIGRDCILPAKDDFDIIRKAIGPDRHPDAVNARDRATGQS
jgi:hypothetical protein